jgi:hypothetical protein
MNDEESSASCWERRSQFTMNITGCASVFFLLAILCYDQQEDLAKFGYKLNMKQFFKKHPSIFLANIT